MCVQELNARYVFLSCESWLSYVVIFLNVYVCVENVKKNFNFKKIWNFSKININVVSADRPWRPRVELQWIYPESLLPDQESVHHADMVPCAAKVCPWYI